MTDDVTHVGDISYVRKHFEEKNDEEANRREEMVTAAFPGDTTATNKALVLASLFMLVSFYIAVLEILITIIHLNYMHLCFVG